MYFIFKPSSNSFKFRSTLSPGAWGTRRSSRVGEGFDIFVHLPSGHFARATKMQGWSSRFRLVISAQTLSFSAEFILPAPQSVSLL